MISVIGTELPVEERYVQIGLQESGADYGYLYVPSGHVAARDLIFAAAQNRADLMNMETVQQIAPQWFYFEGK